MGALIVFLAIAAAFGVMPFLLTYLAARGTERENRTSASAKVLPPIGSGGTLLRLLVVVLCSVLSGYGFFTGLVVALASVSLPSGTALVPLVYSYALMSHVIMCIAWIENRRLSIVWPITGMTSIVVSFLLPATRAGFGSGSPYLSVLVLLVEVVFVLPSFFLAIYLAWFHWDCLGSERRLG
jgi:hypothetical protein